MSNEVLYYIVIIQHSVIDTGYQAYHTSLVKAMATMYVDQWVTCNTICNEMRIKPYYVEQLHLQQHYCSIISALVRSSLAYSKCNQILNKLGLKL